jgi:hypothetical protein
MDFFMSYGMGSGFVPQVREIEIEPLSDIMVASPVHFQTIR